MSHVSDMFYKLRRDKEEAFRNNWGEMQRFSVTLNTLNLRKLDFIAKSLDMQRSSLAKDIIIKALADAEEALGLSIYDREAMEFEADMDGVSIEEVQAYYSEYGKYIYEGEEPEWFSNSNRKED